MNTTGRRQPKESALRRWRLSNGLTLEDIEGLTGKDASYISRLERGERQLRPIERVRFARAVGARVDELFPPSELP